MKSPKENIPPGAGHLKASRFYRELGSLYTGIDESDTAAARHIFMRDHRDKITDSAGYSSWLAGLFDFLKTKYSLDSRKILDMGCGTGELTVRMNLLGYEAVGADLHTERLDLARVLAVENGLCPDIFKYLNPAVEKLPFDDKSFDIVTMLSVLEHIDDDTAGTLFSEIARVCRGVVFVLVPNRIKRADDHTGLWFVPPMPSVLAETYVKLRGAKYRYYISASGGWDVKYRTWNELKSIFEPIFEGEFAPYRHMFPREQDLFFGKKIKTGLGELKLGARLPAGLLAKITGMPREAFFEYLNFILKPVGNK